MSIMRRFKGFLKMSLGLVLVAPCPVGLAAGIPIEEMGKHDQNAIIAQFENSPEYEQAVQYRDERLAYIAEFKPDNPASSVALEKEKEYLNAKTKNKDGFMYAVLKESEFGQAYAKAQTRYENGLTTALICGLDGAFLIASSAGIVKEIYCDDHYFGAISRNLIAAGAVQAFGKKENED